MFRKRTLITSFLHVALGSTIKAPNVGVYVKLSGFLARSVIQ